jgi:anti-anti-sigma factor
MATLERTELGDVTVLKLKGSLTMEGLEQVQDQFQELTRRPGAHMLVDLTEVEMVTTPALSMFLAAASTVKNSGGRLIFTESRPPVRDILKRLRLHSVLTTVPGYEEALGEARRK